MIWIYCRDKDSGHYPLPLGKILSKLKNREEFEETSYKSPKKQGRNSTRGEGGWPEYIPLVYCLVSIFLFVRNYWSVCLSLSICLSFFFCFSLPVPFLFLTCLSFILYLSVSLYLPVCPSSMIPDPDPARILTKIQSFEIS